MERKMTYISLFSGAGVGCYGFKKEDFECIATNELIARRLDIQKYNQKCKYNSGYISGDITDSKIQDSLFDQVDFWKKEENIDQVDVVVATPPCQGMSTANYKKGDETKRNSLVVEAIHIVSKIHPRVFVFENVRAFLKTLCIDKDEEVLTIKDCIDKHLSEKYNIYSKVVNFMDYGVPSSRPRTLVIGTLKSEMNFSPLNIFPLKQKRITVREAIGDFESLQYGQKSKTDALHSFRIYPEYMQAWIHSLKEGETAFNNPQEFVPYKIVDGKRKILKSGHMGNKFRRMYWDQPAPCITTRNDQLASQSTIHPKDDRVLSIHELMRVMSIPDSFKWVPDDNSKTIDSCETLIRQSIGEAVPTIIMWKIAKNIKDMIEYDDFIKSGNKSGNTGNFYIKSYLFEKSLSDSKETGSFYTPQAVVYNTIKEYSPSKKELKLLEPSVGVGAFIPQMLRLVDDCEKVEFTCVDISKRCLNELKRLIKSLQLENKFKFKYVCEDFLQFDTSIQFDAIISNPPYYKMKADQKKKYKSLFNYTNDNIFCLFLKKYANLSNEIMVVIPKIFLMIPDCKDVRDILKDKYNIVSIYDYGVSYFKEVFIEILSIHFKSDYSKDTFIKDCRNGESHFAKQGYIYDDSMWLIYKNEWFCKYKESLELDTFEFIRDRAITNSKLSNSGKYWVIKSKNILDDGSIVHIEGYDKYIDNIENIPIGEYLNSNAIIMVNFTYNTRATILPKNSVPNGSIAILIPKKDINVDLSLYATKEFREYYAIVKNKSRFTLNIDACSIKYIGIKK